MTKNNPSLSLLGNSKVNDGVNHINIHSKGNTYVGKALSHFIHQPFLHPHYGPFYSMEGFWYFTKTGFNEKVANKMRYLSGYRAKQRGCELPYVKNEHFEDVIMAANYQKIIQNEQLRKEFVESSLPFDHYYTFGEGERIINPKGHEWLIEGFEQMRREMQADEVPSVWLRENERYLNSGK